jgi:Family of unknown function (DUF6599)
MIKKGFWSLLWVLILTAALQGQSRESVLKAVQETSKWSPADKPVSYDKKNLEALAGARASTISRYGFIGAVVQNWTGPNGNVRLTLYEMFDASAAYGLFTLDRNLDQTGFTPLPMGTEGFRTGSHTEFWQSKYVVNLDGTASATEDLARTIAENIFGRSRKPPVSSHLPPADLVQGSDRYVVDAAGIRKNLNLDPKTLGFDDSVEVATADYRTRGNTAHLVLLWYPTQQIAKKYEEQWAAIAPNDAAFRKRTGALLALVRGSRDTSVAKSILDGVNLEHQVTWDQPRPDLSLRTVILTIFSFIGIALLFTLVVGVSFGGFRIFVKARYPDRVFDRPEDMEIIQLKLAEGVIHKQLRE